MACRSFGFSTRLFSAHTSLTVRCEEQNKVINNRSQITRIRHRTVLAVQPETSIWQALHSVWEQQRQHMSVISDV